MSQAAAEQTFGECREGYIPRCSAALQIGCPVACSGVVGFSHIDRVLTAMEGADIMVTTKQGRAVCGARQIMDITNKAYLFYCERAAKP